MIYLLALPMTFLGALGAFFFKRAAMKADGILPLFTNKELYLGGMFYVSGAILNILLLQYLQYSILYPMTAITYIWTAMISHRLLGEKMSKRVFLGIVMICVGVGFLTR